ncbi:MAG: hypothetical protein ACOVP4_04630 [Bacteriovoracaceae bacterium]
MTETVLIHHQKFYITHTKDKNREAVVELKIWRVNDSRYPENMKYSLFCVDLETLIEDFFVQLKKHGFQL